MNKLFCAEPCDAWNAKTQGLNLILVAAGSQWDDLSGRWGWGGVVKACGGEVSRVQILEGGVQV